MNRRRFLAATATAGTAAAAVAASRMPGAGNAAPKPLRGRPVLGHQHQSSDSELKVLSSLGVEHICSAVPSRKLDEGWSVAGLSQLRERVEKHGIKLDMVPLPMGSTPTATADTPYIMRGKSPERDREIDGICQMIRNAAQVGIPAVKYNLTLIGVVRTTPTPGRGTARYSTFVYSQSKAGDPPPPESGPASTDQMWERIEYFLKRVVPVAAEHKVRLCCHPHDPGMPPGKGYRGIERVLGSVDGLKKFVEIQSSPYHGLNFCQGTVCEMLEQPAKEIFEVIRWFGERNKIFNVHFRNIKGGFLNFRETFLDDGDVDMLRALRTYRDVGYGGMIMPDHVPAFDGDTRGAQSFAYSFGYIKALLQVVNSEV